MTFSSASITESIAIQAPPAAVLDLVGDPEQLSRWAPGFARRVRRDGDHWIVENEAGERRVRIRVIRELGVVDFLAPDADGGAFSRVVETQEGSEMLFTLVVAPDATAEQRETQRAVIAGELAAVRDLVQGGGEHPRSA